MSRFLRSVFSKPLSFFPILSFLCIATLQTSCDEGGERPQVPDLTAGTAVAGVDIAGDRLSRTTSGETAGEESAGAGEIVAGELAAGELVAGEAVSGEENHAGEYVAGETLSSIPWSKRLSCDVEISYHNPSAQRVQLAGSFTAWGESPLEMYKSGESFTIKLSPSELGLHPRERYPYKFIVDGQWILDPLNAQQQFDGDCVNSAFTVSDCSIPQVTFKSLETEWVDESAGMGRLQGKVEVALSEVADSLSQVSVLLDGQELSTETSASAGEITFEFNRLTTGKHRVSVSVVDSLGVSSKTRSASVWLEPKRFEWLSTPMYMLLVDRFANGEPTNDARVGAPVGYSADWHGGDLQGALRALEDGYFDRLGVKAIWLSPINRQVEGHFPDRVGEGRRFSAYHGYWPVSGREVDPRYGGDEGLEAFVRAAHARGIRVLLDLINNQIHEQHEYYQTHPEWFRTSCVCGLDAGCGWSERPLDCLFASYLPDINWRARGAEDQFISDALYWVDRFDIDGFRVDAVKHVETTSIYNLRDALRERFEGDGHGSRVWMFGETAVGEGDQYNDGCGVHFQSGYEWIDAYTGPQALDGQFDFPSHHRMRWPLLSGLGSYWEIDSALADAQARYKSGALHVRFLGSHDSTRVASEASLDPQLGCRYLGDPGCDQLSSIPADSEVYDRLRRAWLLLWTSPGIPLLYYGDEVALAGGNDPDSRRDMPWATPLTMLAMSEDGVSEQSLSSQQVDLRTWFEALALLKDRYLTLSTGDWQTIWVWDDVYVYTRYGLSHRGNAELSVIALSQSNHLNEIEIPIPEPLRSALDHQRRLGTEPNIGAGTLSANEDKTSFTLILPSGEASIWVWSTEEF